LGASWSRPASLARELGYSQLTLWTNDIPVAARRNYQAAGFRLVSETPHHSFGHDLVGQIWTLELLTAQLESSFEAALAQDPPS
jgi:hypothetical protein